jgi:hypothetical protein
MTLVRRRPRFPPLQSATPPCEAENADHPLLPVVSFSMSPPVPFRMSFDNEGLSARPAFRFRPDASAPSGKGLRHARDRRRHGSGSRPSVAAQPLLTAMLAFRGGAGLRRADCHLAGG